MKMHLSGAAGLVLFASSPFVWGQQITFEYIDSDGNDSLSKEEVAAIAVRFPGRPDPEDVFARWDANSDGKVTKQEFESRPRGGQRNR